MHYSKLWVWVASAGTVLVFPFPQNLSFFFYLSVPFLLAFLIVIFTPFICIVKEDSGDKFYLGCNFITWYHVVVRRCLGGHLVQCPAQWRELLQGATRKEWKCCLWWSGLHASVFATQPCTHFWGEGHCVALSYTAWNPVEYLDYFYMCCCQAIFTPSYTVGPFYAQGSVPRTPMD